MPAFAIGRPVFASTTRPSTIASAAGTLRSSTSWCTVVPFFSSICTVDCAKPVAVAVSECGPS